MSSEEPKQKPEIIVDEDWKERVKAENMEFDRQGKQPAPPVADAGIPVSNAAESASPAAPELDAAPEFDRSQLAATDFSTLVALLSTQAMAAFGMFSDGEDEPEPQPELARHFIDLLGVLEEKTKGNLTPTESRMLIETLHQLRIAFVEFTKAGRAAR